MGKNFVPPSNPKSGKHTIGYSVWRENAPGINKMPIVPTNGKQTNFPSVQDFYDFLDDWVNNYVNKQMGSPNGFWNWVDTVNINHKTIVCPAFITKVIKE